MRKRARERELTRLHAEREALAEIVNPVDLDDRITLRQSVASFRRVLLLADMWSISKAEMVVLILHVLNRASDRAQK